MQLNITAFFTLQSQFCFIHLQSILIVHTSYYLHHCAASNQLDAQNAVEVLDNYRVINQTNYSKAQSCNYRQHKAFNV